MPWSMSNPPSVAKNWTKEEKRRCVRAANATLKAGKSERDAIFACIAAAGKSKQKQIDENEYDATVEDGLNTFQELVELYLLGQITLSVLRARFQEALRLHYTRLMVLHIGQRDPTDAEVDFLNTKLEAQEILLEGFLADLAAGAISPNRALWRAGMYAPARDVYIGFSVPMAVVALMPGLPGEICLGQNLCGCWLDVEMDDEGNVYVYWMVDPLKESCIVCLDMESQNPFVFSAEEVASVT
jgi:hypothetical protein